MFLKLAFPLGLTDVCSVTPLEILTAFLASVFHDVGHPGVNSMFLLNSHNHIAGKQAETRV